MSEFQGKVDIVGAGPGSPDFLTVIGQDILAQAEVLIYDALIHPKLLTLPKENCQLINVGKRGGRQSPKQSQINEQLILACQAGQRVVRLKCGDPFIFGRTTSEVEALTAAGCCVQVWPGLSSVFAAPLLAGFPLTDPVLSQVVTLVSGHHPTSLNWSAIAQSDTVVILMGARNLETLLIALRSAGKPAQTPVAIVQWCSWPQQQSWFGTLENIGERMGGSLHSPSVVIVGQVVSLREQFLLSSKAQPLNQPLNQPFKMSQRNAQSSEVSKSYPPLLGKHIVVTRAVEQSSVFCDCLKSLGASVLEFPALEIVPPSNWDAVDQALQQLEQFQWLLLTSANAVDYFFQGLTRLKKDARALSGVKIAVVGRKTAQALHSKGIIPDFIPENYVADSLLETFPEAQDLSGLSLLFPRVESGGRDVLVQAFRARGADVTEVAIYQSRCPLTIPEGIVAALRDQQIDAITFASSKTVRHVIQLLIQATESTDEPAKRVQEWFASICIASIGPQTTQTCVELLGRVDVEAREYTLEGLTQSLIDYYRPQPSG